MWTKTRLRFQTFVTRLYFTNSAINCWAKSTESPGTARRVSSFDQPFLYINCVVFLSLATYPAWSYGWTRIFVQWPQLPVNTPGLGICCLTLIPLYPSLLNLLSCIESLCQPSLLCILWAFYRQRSGPSISTADSLSFNVWYNHGYSWFESNMFIFIVFKMGGLYVIQTDFKLPSSSNAPASALQVTRSIGVCHHT